jgi:hypothetical protein
VAVRLGGPVGAFVFQALALCNGPISVVQPLLATGLVFMLVLRRFWDSPVNSHGHLGPAALTCVSLTVFLIAEEPGGGRPAPASHHWFTAGLASCAGAERVAVRRALHDEYCRAGNGGGRVTVMCAAVVFLTQTTPAAMKADVQQRSRTMLGTCPDRLRSLAVSSVPGCGPGTWPSMPRQRRDRLGRRLRVAAA